MIIRDLGGQNKKTNMHKIREGVGGGCGGGSVPSEESERNSPNLKTEVMEKVVSVAATSGGSGGGGGGDGSIRGEWWWWR